MLSFEYLDVLLKAEPNFAICPAYSKGVDDFVKHSSYLVSKGCSVVFGNSCAVSQRFKESFVPFEYCGFVNLTSLNREIAPIKLMVDKEKCINCLKCKCCMSIIDIPLKYNSNAKQKFYVEEWKKKWKNWGKNKIFNK